MAAIRFMLLESYTGTVRMGVLTFGAGQSCLGAPGFAQAWTAEGGRRHMSRLGDGQRE
jgi:hypothetical protein